ncbi:hypothetical protein [Maribellus maritimus]|uniref:hypothetical protein n=1 Tax=Maribellus maritimus TaxID=2870838 RepID=UPI001EEC8BFD|nr:hypothetical protein [Maribellus maritimus]MCG6189904.1 hypothetical protein [Maribellus maritimus]
MVQELITYMIIGAAIAVAAMKTIKKFGKKRAKEKHAKNCNTSKAAHNCSDCSAECMLRNAVNPLPERKNEKNLCQKIEIKSK